MDSFSLPDQKPTFSQETAAPIAPQVGLVGGAIRGGLELRDPSKDQPGVMDALFKFAEKIGDERVAEWKAQKRDEAFMAGVGRAAQGEAAKDIAASQPWYAKLFGGGNVVAGARAWEGITDANQMEASFMERMKDLRELPPEKAQAALLEMHKQMGSGDPTRDGARNAMFVKSLPGILKLHAKAHVSYQQEVATEAQRKGIQSALNGYSAKVQAVKSVDRDDDSDLDQPKADLAALFKVPQGVNPDTYNAQIVEGMANGMAMGKFEAYTEAKKQGLLNGLPRQYARQLEQLHDTEARKVAFDRAPAHLKDRLFSIAGMDAASTAATLNSINEEFTLLTGLEIPLVPTEKYQTLVQSAARRDEAKAAERARKAERAEDKAEREAARAEEKNAKLAVAIADEAANNEAANKLVEAVLDDPRPGSVKVGMLSAKGSDALKIAQQRLPLVAAERWGNPKLEAGEQEALDQIADPLQRQEAQRAVEAKARNKLLMKDDLDLTAVREQVKSDLSSGNYMVAAQTIEALAFGAEGSGMQKLPANFARVVPEEHRAVMTAYITALGAQGPNPKTGRMEVDHAALWAAAEAKTMFTSKKPPTKAQLGELKAAVEKEGGGYFFGNDDMKGTQASKLMEDVATRVFDGRVSADNLTPHGDAIARAKEQIQMLPGTGVAYLKNPQAPVPVHDDRYLRALPKADQAYLSTPDRVGFALKDAAEARGMSLDNNARVYRADDTPGGAPYFVILGQGPGTIEVISMADMLAAAKKRYAKLTDKPVPSGDGSYVAP
jgi:hypothetical protein